MSEPQLKIRIRLDQSADHPEIEQHSPELPKEPVSPTPPPEYEYNWPRIITAGAGLLLVLIVIIWAALDSSSDEEVLETNPTEIPLSITPPITPEPSSIKSAQPVTSAEYLSRQLSENDSGDGNTLLKNNGSNHTEKASGLPPKQIPKPPAKPGVKPDFTASQSKSGNNSQEISRSSGLVRAQLTSNIRRRQPVDSIDQISLDGKSIRPIFLFLHLSQLKNKKILINWYYRNRSIAKISLLIGKNDWRTYSSKVLDQNRLGPWRVTASDQTGKLLAEFKFNVTR